MFTEEWYGPGNCVALFNCAITTRRVAGRVIEVGCWEGRSTVHLAKGAYPETVHAVDTWQGSPGEISADLASARDVLATFVGNMTDLTKGNVAIHRQGWRDYFTDDRGPIRLVHIDAEHTYREVFDTIETVLPLMVAGGIICGDDYHHPPVRKAVLEFFPRVKVAGETLWFHQC